MSSKQHKGVSDLTLEIQLLQDCCEVVNTPRSLMVFKLCEYEEWEQLSDLSINPSDYEDVGNFADDYLVTEMIRKSPNLPLNNDKQEEALSSFLMSEFKCFSTNNRLLSSVDRPDWFHSFKKNVDRVLGSLHNALPLIEKNFQHGPGATTGVTGAGSVLSDKYDGEIHLTAELVPFFKAILGPHWHANAKGPHRIVEGSKFTSVPKTAKTNRGICVEPTLNMFVQKGIGTYLRSRLRRFGLDLNHGHVRNASLAKAAYEQRLSTIDLSAASDSISWALIYEVIPQDWFSLLDICRSKRVRLGDEYHDLEKWSSMGNGYTFELESLLFFCLVQAIVPKDYHDLTAVYGDDIICPEEYSLPLIEALNFLGFSVNTRKSFLAGNFFESCGSDYFKGKPVRPFYLKGSNKGIPYVVQAANKLRHYASQRYGYVGCDPRFKRIWTNLYKSIPKPWRNCKVPLELGDSGVLDDNPNYRPAKFGLEGKYVEIVLLSPRKRRKETFSPYLSTLLHMHRNEPRSCSTTSATYGREPVRGYLGRIRTKWVLVNPGPSGLGWLSTS